MQAAERNLNEPATLQLAAFYWHSGSREKARGLLERQLKTALQPAAVQALLGWVLVSASDTEPAAEAAAEAQEAARLFQQALQQNPTDLQVRRPNV